MSDKDIMRVDDALELAALLRPIWPAISAGIRDSGVPTCEGDPNDGGDPPGDDPDTGPSDADAKAEAEKWKALARKHEARAKENAEAARKLSELEEQGKTDTQRLADKAADAEKRAGSAEAQLTRLHVALDNAPEGMPLSKVHKLASRLAGDTRAELEADAAELFADFAPGDDAPSDSTTTRRQPRERLKPGTGGTDDPVPDDATPLERLSRAYSTQT